jgi:glycosyltransferase involved in cell wall biosynthesis
MSENLSANFVNIYLPDVSNDQEFMGKCCAYSPNKINFIVSGINHIDAIYLKIEKLGPVLKNYLYPFWELDRIHYSKLAALNSYDEIIAPSNFIANTLSNFLNKEIKRIPHPVRIPKNSRPNIIKGGILKIFTFVDFNSFVARKNPKGALDAFQLAFPKNCNDVQLIIKVRGMRDDGARKILQAYCEEDSRIKIIDKTISRDAMDQLLGECNVYISMHRAEGLGLGPAEALANEKIVVSTNYGGTTDFITKATGYPVDYKLVPVKPNEYVNDANQLWAEPSIESAAESLKDIYDHYESALNRGINGRKFMINQHSFHAAGQALKLLMKH